MKTKRLLLTVPLTAVAVWSAARLDAHAFASAIVWFGRANATATSSRAADAAPGDISGGAESLGTTFKMALLSAKEPDARLSMAVEGVRVQQVADTWGAARSGGRGHAGQDIFAKRGTPVYSAAAGYVLRVGESPVGGKTVFVLGAGGRRYYYAHLDAHAPGLAAGDEVTADTLLGYVGATGNAKGTPPHLHFGVYTFAGALDPLPLLADRA